MSQFLDHVFIEVTSGDGGNGMVAWRREKYEPLGGPAGGNGGRGGSVYLEATNDLSTLIDFRYKHKFLANPGKKGGPKSMHGRKADDLIIRVPVGTVVRDAETGEQIADLVAPGHRIMVAEGGMGGRGNAQLATHAQKAPHYCEPGQPGVFRRLELELKILADVGIIGLPNAGKSTLLSVVSAAKPKIADYPFSTLEPNLGVVKAPDGERSFVMADIPGLVEGAARGVGLGHDFLRHVERTRVLLHMVDIGSETLSQDIETIDNELELYSEHLQNLPEILVLNKADILPSEDVEAIVRKVQSNGAGKRHSPPVVISAATRNGVEELLKKTLDMLGEVKPHSEEEDQKSLTLPPDSRASDHGDTAAFEIIRKKGTFTVIGDRVERIVSVTNMRDPESLHHLHYVLRSMGIIDALIQEGAKPGVDITIGGVTFEFGNELS